MPAHGNAVLAEMMIGIERVTIGDHIIVGALSLVNNSLPSGVKAFGQPAKIMGAVDVRKIA